MVSIQLLCTALGRGSQDTHPEILASFDVCQIIAKANQISVDKVISQGNVVAPELEFFWPTVTVNQRLETPLNNLYVIGDAAGIAQGNLQAAICGITAANGIINAIT